MIELNERECALECTVCGEFEGISPKAPANEATLKLLTDRVARDHAECERWRKNPARARAERQYKRRMQAELRGL